MHSHQEQNSAMALIPRWKYMTPEAKALSKKVGIGFIIVVITLWLFKGLLPWILGALILIWILKSWLK